MQIFIASDHGGFNLKAKIMEMLVAQNYTPSDLGANQLIPDDDYPQYAFKVATRVASQPDSMGILICRSGIGMSIAANKVKGCYAALCFTPEHAKQAREHNNSNVLCLDADYMTEEQHLATVKAFLETPNTTQESRHIRRIEQIKQYEKDYLK